MNLAGSFALATCIMVLFVGKAHAGQASASWVFRGTTLGEGQSAIFNVGDAFAIQCLGRSGAVLAAQAASTVMSFIVTTDTVPKKVTVTPSDGTIYPKLAIDQGTLFYDSVQGPASSSSQLFTSVYMPVVTAAKSGRGVFTMFIPRLTINDAKTYYCTYTDGSADSSAATTPIGSSTGFRLIVSTKPGSTSVRSSRNKFLEYAALLVSVSTLVL